VYKKAAAAGCDALVFGAETPDAALLMEAARVLSGAEYRAALKARSSWTPPPAEHPVPLPAAAARRGRCGRDRIRQ